MQAVGPFTQLNLQDLSWLNQAKKGQLSRDGARFGLELSQSAYAFNTGPWLAAGFTDISIQVNQRLFSGVKSSQAQRDWQQGAINLVLPRLAHRLKDLSSPMDEIRLARGRQVDTQTGKSITMMAPLGKGRYLIAIGFMGTGRRPQDWACNFHFGKDGEVHAGFLEVCQQFEQKADRIEFPTLAAELGKSSFSLQDVLEECKQEDSRFLVVMAGHSQGGAVLQTFMLRRLQEGVKAQHLLGYGFASPKAVRHLPKDELDCPITHFVTSDDVFARLGLNEHLGRCYELPVNETMREKCYGEMMNNPLFLSLLTMYQQVRTTGDSLLFSIGFLQALEALPLEEAAGALSVFFNNRFKNLLPQAQDRVGRALRHFAKGFYHSYQDATGRPVPENEVEALRAQLADLIKTYGAANVTRMLLKALHTCHALVSREPGRQDLAPYSYLVVRAFADLVELQEG